jgi:hypothetical protein
MGNQRKCPGIVDSATNPIANSTKLHTAIAWTVLMWFCTPHRCVNDTLANPGANSCTDGRIVMKYGACEQKNHENASFPSGYLDNVCHVCNTFPNDIV